MSATDEGTPQGGPLSSLLSNLLLDDLDRELEERGHRFVRYADDCNIYVRSKWAGQRVMESVTYFLETLLKPRVNQQKSAVARPSQRKFLGSSFTGGEKVRRRIARKAISRFKERIQELTRRSRGISGEQMIAELRQYQTGWWSYFGFSETPGVLEDLDGWIRRKLRCFLWKQWKRGRVRYQELTKRGVKPRLAAHSVRSPKRPLASEQEPGPEHRPLQRMVRLPGPPPTGTLTFIPNEPPCMDPYAPWCDRGSR